MFKKLKDTLAGTTATAVASEATETVATVPQPKTATKTAASTDAAGISAEPRKSSEPKSTDEMELTDEQKATVMGKLIATMKNPPVIGDLVEGPVIAIEKSSVFVDLAPFGTGIIYGREFIIARDVIKKINIGDVIAFLDNRYQKPCGHVDPQY